MSRIQHLIGTLEFNRPRTLGLLEKIEQEPDAQRVLAWRPGPGRAHIGWQLMHIGITEELFATERLKPEKVGQWLELWPRFRGGSTPDDNAPTPAEIREVLSGARQHLLETLATFDDSQLGWVAPALAARQLHLLDVLHILGWHEAHHQGQAHITFNLYKAQA
ncbi:MAG TPA: DinB family protein [Pirellulaceae bacterium]|nr:DinB family protein [Pirellulaceae bacterium]